MPHTRAIMLCFLIGALVVIYYLQRAVSRRTRPAIKAQRLQLESQSRLTERTRLAAELHDYHAQNLTAISYQLSAARNALGNTAFSPEIAAQLKSDPNPPELTARQQDVLNLLAQGLSSDEVAIRLGISTDAVNQHIDSVRKKFGAANRTESVAIAFKRHLLKTDDRIA